MARDSRRWAVPKLDLQSTSGPRPRAHATIMKKIKIIVVIAVIMGIEGAVTYFMFSASGGSAATAEDATGEEPAADEHAAAEESSHGHGKDEKKEEKKDAHGGGHGGGHGKEEEAPKKRPTGKDASIEVLLGDFNATKYLPQANTTLRITFQLYGTVAVDKEQEVKDLVEERKHRLREQILEIVRSAEMNDLADPVLGLIKRKILEKSNRLLGKPLIKGVVFSDFSFYEQ